MRPLCALLGLAAMLGCTPQRGTRIEVDGTVQYFTFEGGFWAIQGDDGFVYDPISFPADFRKAGLRVHAVLDRLDDMASVHMAGYVVEVLSMELLLPCGPVPCPLPAPPVRLEVFPAPGASPVNGVSLASVAGPPGVEVVVPPCTPGPTPPAMLCSIGGTGAGTYEADVEAPGFETVHVRAEVPARSPLPGECCQVTYVSQYLPVSLSPG
jgi:hypothetical protein